MGNILNINSKQKKEAAKEVAIEIQNKKPTDLESRKKLQKHSEKIIVGAINRHKIKD